ncbi:sulfate ABC transporter ATP-binding protein [bacterium]|nr:sulfate ABC transporter ATP-binding protein [bacterium]
MIEIDRVSRKFGDFVALDAISLNVPDGTFLALLGPSGSGKTSLLRIISGLEVPDSGQIRFNGQDIQDQSPRDRGVGFVFQHYALFRHMTVYDNVAFGLRVKPKSIRPSESMIKAKVMELLRLVQLDWLADRFPSQLSGGQRQRIALARALAVEPKVLLLDEPFGALDTNIRRELRQWLRNLHDSLGITSIFVTHDVDEAMEVSDQIVVMNSGKIEQLGTPEEVYHKPANAFVYKFIGNVNLFHGRMDADTIKFGKFEMDASGQKVGHSEAVRAYVRPDSLRIHLTTETAPVQFFGATVKRIRNHGVSVRVELTSEWGEAFEVTLDQTQFAQMSLSPGLSVWVSVDEDKVFYEDFSI